MAAHADPLRAVAQLQDAVHTLAPALRPQVLPKGAAYGLDLVLGLCPTAAQKQALRALVHAAKPTAEGAANGSDNDEREAQAVGAFDVDKKVFNVEKIVWMTQQDAVVHEFARFLELQLASPDEARAIATHFLEANGHAPSNTLAAEQCFNAAFALQTLLRAFPRPPVAVAGELVEIDETTDIAAVFAPLLRAKKPAGDKSSSSKNNKKTNKAKSSRDGAASKKRPSA